MSANDLCAVCDHDHEGTVGVCPACGCKGFWRKGSTARRCENPECEGLNCVEVRSEEARALIP